MAAHRIVLPALCALVLIACPQSREGRPALDGSVRLDAGGDAGEGGAPIRDGGPDGPVDVGPPDSGPITDCSGSGVPVNCPSDAPDRSQMCGACCWRQSNADRLDRPELRMSGLRPTAPATLSSAIVRGLFQGAIDEERFNWLFRATVSGSSVSLEMGHGFRNPDGTFRFASGEAPPPGDAARWDPVVATGTIVDERMALADPEGTVTLPILDEEGAPMVELPLRRLGVDRMAMTHGRTCVGERRASSYGTDAGHFSAYVTVAEAEAIPLEVGSTLSTTLCGLLAGLSSDPSGCDAAPQTDWPVPPDSLCDAAGCRLGTCAGATCNAWQVTGELAAHGVEIVD